MMIDTDVLIWFLRGNERARIAVDAIHEPSVSVVTYIELMQGMRNKQELLVMQKAFASKGIKVRHIDEDISMRAAGYVERFFLSHSLELADALIAATCVASSEALLTANARHYAVIAALDAKIFRP